MYVTYKLEGATVKIIYKIVNDSDKVMPFGFGQHPAFNCPLGFKDTKIVMDDKDELVISDDTASGQYGEIKNKINEKNT